MMTHISGLGEGDRAAVTTRALAELIPLYLAAPMQYEPDHAGIHAVRINADRANHRIASGMSFDAFVQKRIFDPLA